MYCPVCGFKLIKELVPGSICDCCGYEYDVTDYITLEELEISKDYKNFILNSLQNKILDLNINKENVLPIDIVHEILRSKWIYYGCKWKWNDKNKKPKDWGIDRAKKQLQNINIDIDIYLKQ
ncbi:hypothetical protein WG909_07785 [Peptostreptococcaceae bacterium AGR-M142]